MKRFFYAIAALFVLSACTEAPFDEEQMVEPATTRAAAPVVPVGTYYVHEGNGVREYYKPLNNKAGNAKDANSVNISIYPAKGEAAIKKVVSQPDKNNPYRIRIDRMANFGSTLAEPHGIILTFGTDLRVTKIEGTGGSNVVFELHPDYPVKKTYYNATTKQLYLRYMRRVYTSAGTTQWDIIEETLTFTGVTPTPLAFTPKIMSFNTRNDSSWSSRKAGIFSMVKSVKPMVMGTQETTSSHMSNITGSCTDYSSYGVARGGSVLQNPGEMCALFWRKADVKCLKTGTFWLSTTPTKASKLAASNYNRICSWGLFQHIGTSIPFYVCNIHLDNISDNAVAVRKQQMEIMIAEMKKINTTNVPMFVLGDFNSGATEACHTLLTSNYGLKAARPASDKTSTMPGSTAIFDHIYFNDTYFDCTSFQTLTGRYGLSIDLSDHYPVVATFTR